MGNYKNEKPLKLSMTSLKALNDKYLKATMTRLKVLNDNP